MSFGDNEQRAGVFMGLCEHLLHNRQDAGPSLTSVNALSHIKQRQLNDWWQSERAKQQIT